jgi:hypothetical protein
MNNSTKRKLRDVRDSVLIWLGVLLFLWFFIAEIVFSFRNPWMTDTERFIHTPDALMFRKLEYKKVRGLE